MTPSNHSIVQANMSTVGSEAVVSPLPTSRSVQTLPEQTPVRMLSRLRYLTEFSWSTTSSGVLWLGDVENLLRTNLELAPLLAQYRYYRANFKVMIRINSNQFYSGALMVSSWPMYPAMGQYREQRALLTPVTMSASTQQSAEVEIAYGYNREWLRSTDPAAFGVVQPTYVAVEVLSPLVASSDTLTDTITVQVFACYVDPVLQLNADPGDVPVAQSKIEVTSKIGGKDVKSHFVPTPAKDANLRGNGADRSFSETAPTLSSIPILGTVFGSLFDILKIGVNTVSGLAPTVGALAPLAPLLLDKPEVVVDPTRTFNSVCSDHFTSDTAALAVPVTYSKNNYGTMLSGLGVRLGTWTIAQYAALPGLAKVVSLTNLAPTGAIPTALTPTPLGRCVSMFCFWKASLRITMQAYASAFTSARLAIYMRPTSSTSTNYDDHIVKIIDIKGDTTVSFTVPFVNDLAWYQDTPPFTLEYKLLTPIIGNDSALDPTIGLVFWLAGGPDAQFAMERRPDTWSVGASYPLPPLSSSEKVAPPPPSSKTRRLRRVDAPPLPSVPGAVKQSAIQTHFSSASFDPIVDQCSYLIDDGYAMTDVPVTFNDVLKRYRPFVTSISQARDFYQNPDFTEVTHSAFLNCFGVVRGGYSVKTRMVGAGESDGLAKTWPITTIIGNTHQTWMTWSASSDGWHCLSFPWMYGRPFYFRSDPNPFFNCVQLEAASTDWFGTCFYAFRDDLELGLPVLPLTGY